MPRVCYFDGITIYMYWNEGDHQVAHFHAHYRGGRAAIALDGLVLAGEIDAAALRQVREWMKEREAELRDNWERARRLEPIAAIDPLG